MIGNSRWHWAELRDGQWACQHRAPDPTKLQSVNFSTLTWAAVGAIPNNINLPIRNKLAITDVPLKELPSWIGIDRALAGWGALIRAKSLKTAFTGLLVADTGTVLSITRITQDGSFLGGQLAAGFRLQLKAMSTETVQLNDPGNGIITDNPFPSKTEEAMRRGSLQSLIGTIIEAQKIANLPIWLCGGDSELLFKALRQQGIEVHHYPNLALEGMIDIQKNYSIPKSERI